MISYDYEQSALFVRFLLSEPQLAIGFRKFLKDFAGGEVYTPEGLAADLGASWEDLERRFQTVDYDHRTDVNRPRRRP